MANDIDLGKISIAPKGDWNDKVQVEYNDIWRYGGAKYLAIQDSTGIVPSDDKVYWYELSSQGKSAYQQAVDNGYSGSEAEWLQSLRQPAVDAAQQAADAIENMDRRFPEKMNEIKSDLSAQISQEIADRVVKPIVISSKEEKTGSFKVGGESHDLYERTFQLSGLPKMAGSTSDVILSGEALGYGIYLSIEGLSVSTGKKLKSEFFNEVYEVQKIYVTENLSTVAVIKCKETTDLDLTATLRLMYCKFFGDVIEFDVTLPDTVDKEAVSLEIPPLKYNKKMVFSYITDDSYSIFQYIFSLINKRMVVKKLTTDTGAVFTWHLGMQGDPKYDAYIKEPYYPEHFAQCTDGAGVKHRYATTVSVWADKLKDKFIGQDVTMYWPWMSEKEFKQFFDFGFMCAYHDLIGYEKDKVNTQEEYDKCVDDSVALFKEYVGIVPKLMVEPNGDHKYIDFSQHNDTIQVITAQSGDPRIQLVYPFKDDFTLGKSDVSVKRIFAYGKNEEYTEDLLDILSGFNSASDKSTIYWLIGSAHRSDHWESELIAKIHELYGDIGNDSLWFPTLDEFFEYWYMRENTMSVKTVTATGVHYKMYVPKGVNFFFRDLSVLISGISSLEGVSVRSGENVYGTSFGMNEGKLLVNLDFNPLLMERVNKYVEAFEADYNKEYAYDDAAYFVQMLKPGLQEPYLTRINKWISPPVFETFTVNGGDDNTQSQEVTLNITFSGQAPSHYMASESADFTGAVWIEYKDNPKFRLSDGFTSKTVYVKLKNVYGETPIKSDTITLLEPTLTLNAVTVNGGDGSTVERSVRVSFDYVGYPLYYMLWESETSDGSQWKAFAETPTFELSAAFGEKKVYAKLKNAMTETVVRSAGIELIDTVTARLNSISVNDGNDVTSTGIMQVTFNTMNTVTKYKIGKKADLSDCPEWISWTDATVRYDSGMVEGELTVYAKVGNSTTESDIKSDSIRIVQPVTVTAMSLANGKDSFAGYNVPVVFTIGQGTPTHYRLAESASALNSAAWVAWGEGITYRFATIGSNALYGQVKNEVSESTVVNDSITLTESPLKMIIGLSGTVNNSIEYKLVNGEIVNQVKPVVYSSYDRKQLKDTQGNLLPWYYNLNSSFYNANSVFSTDGMNYYVTQSSANDDGVFPASIFLQCICAASVVADGTKKLRLSFSLPIGHYKVRILYSPSDLFLLKEKNRVNSFYGVFEGENERAKDNVGTVGFTGKGNNQYNNEFEFDVLNGLEIDFAAWQEGSPIENYRPGINLIELTKLS